jgi:hypothetical protein
MAAAHMATLVSPWCEVSNPKEQLLQTISEGYVTYFNYFPHLPTLFGIPMTGGNVPCRRPAHVDIPHRF